MTVKFTDIHYKVIGFKLKKITAVKSRHEEPSQKLVTHEPDSTSSVNIEVIEVVHNFQ